MLTQEQSDKIWSLIKDIKVAMLTSEDDGVLRARPMHNVQDEFKGILWFFTDINAHKVNEVLNNRHVCLSYAEPKDDVYVSLSGHAHAVVDKKLIDKFWNPVAEAWFPEGRDSPHIALLKVTVDQAEYWDAKTNTMMQSLEALKSNLKDGKPEFGQNKKYG